MYNIDSRCPHPRISASYFSTGVSSISMIVQVFEKLMYNNQRGPIYGAVDGASGIKTKIKPKITLDFKVRLAVLYRCRGIGTLKRLVWS